MIMLILTLAMLEHDALHFDMLKLTEDRRLVIEVVKTEADASRVGSIERLVVKNGAKLVKVESHAQLLKYVKISSPGAALEFVRLGTNAFTLGLLSSGSRLVCELGFEKDVLRQTYGMDPRLLRSVAVDRENGVMSQDSRHRHNWSPPVVKKVVNGYIIERSMIVVDFRGAQAITTQVVRLREDVDVQQATVDRKVLSIVKTDASGDWRLYSLAYGRRSW